MFDLQLCPIPEYEPFLLPPPDHHDETPTELIINLYRRSYIANPCDFLLLKAIQPAEMTRAMLHMGLPIVQDALYQIDRVLASNTSYIPVSEIPSQEAMSLINRYIIQCVKDRPTQSEVLRDLQITYQNAYRLKCPDCMYSGKTVAGWMDHRAKLHTTTATDKIVKSIICMEPMVITHIDLNQPILKFIGLSEFIVSKADTRSYEIAHYAYTVLGDTKISHPYLCEKCYVLHQSFTNYHCHTCK